MTNTATGAAPVFLSVPDAPAPARVTDDHAVWPTESLAEGLVALQARLPRIRKGETATVKSDKGSYTYQYADLADVSAQLLPIMAEVGLAFTARPTLVDGVFLLSYALVHVSGEREEGLYPLPSAGSPQAIGSAITYARRYCLLAVTGAAPDNEDDDAQAAMPRAQGRAAGTPDRASVDTEWVAEANRRTAAATTREQLDTVWSAIGPALAGGRIDQVIADRVAAAVRARAAELDAERPPAPVDDPVAEPVPVEPTAEQVRADQDAAAEVPPPPPTPRSVIPPGPDREDQLAALRARAARIAANHPTNGTTE